MAGRHCPLSPFSKPGLRLFLQNGIDEGSIDPSISPEETSRILIAMVFGLITPGLLRSGWGSLGQRYKKRYPKHGKWIYPEAALILVTGATGHLEMYWS